MTFRRTSADTGGAEVVVELELRANAFLPAERIRTHGQRTARPRRVAITFLPGGVSEHFFESCFRLARKGKVNDRGLANPIRMALLARTYDIYLVRPLIAVQRPVYTMLDALSRVLWYERYPI